MYKVRLGLRDVRMRAEFLQHLKAAPALSGPGFCMRLRS
jgi:hypothetical protein